MEGVYSFESFYFQSDIQIGIENLKLVYLRKVNQTLKWRWWSYWRGFKQSRALSLPVKTNQIHCSIGLLKAQERLWKVTQRWRFCLFFGVIRTTISQLQDICDAGIVLFTCILHKAIVSTIKIAHIKKFWTRKGWYFARDIVRVSWKVKTW